ncbi:ABC transporter permease/substrate binding protein [Tetragenococcus koreensis]|uniref:ABC transporter permease/substrate binding protein n=1 Tax=Tetragenococcus koreensis TaxID=290335 RepID=UPI001F487328|nr:ABC transporter permease/substrate binding protein [Tetragenococcus koreensis]MCF1585076.1 ABC transporter permease/substrate binding protein [Tetragenococcus koreensis]MCF1620829.1 ABC transporter permease/substrate binding protein [Tetragenococcus koreensis]MCF1629396.1 ABC transporter permease/substrate binding protein [Tetragenococcus koreensis]MCF1641848.1 ABC transporter permease/substrate binding protein [Tetragenococcus koreensis]MCF1658343.1 ABC transporter permease/substrate bindi
MLDLLQQEIPVADWADAAVDWLTENLSGFFSFLQTVGQTIMDGMTNLLSMISPLILIVLLAVAAYFAFNRKWGMPIFTFLGLLFIYNQDMWGDLLNTITLVIMSSLISVVIGVPLGILMSKSETAQSIIKPILDIMQTMPGFVYLIPAVAFFGIGMVPGVFASVIFSLPPTVRMTNLGIRQVPTELVEASDSFGGTGWQKLFKLEMPLAKGNIFAGINQTIMLALSMVVIASMIGAPGLGQGVLSAVQRSQVGNGFTFGVSIVVLAIVMDRFTQRLNKTSQPKQVAEKKKSKKGKIWIATAVAAVVIVWGAISAFSSGSSNTGNITLAYTEQDDQIASTNVIAEVLEDQGFNVTTSSLDNAVMWESVANGEADAMVGAWLPVTHQAQYEEFKDDLDNLGPNVDKQAQNSFVVPSYMDVDSIEDLDDQAGQVVTGIEPGAGIVQAAENTLEEYPNLEGWQQELSSTGAMTTQLERAIAQEDEIVITGWTPHWMFSRFDIKTLDDPKSSMGDAESIYTFAREGLADDMPEAYQILDNFEWDVKDVEGVMLDMEDGKDPEDAARDWIEDNQDKADSWVE